MKSAFDRGRRQRLDQFMALPGYWPTILHAPREEMQSHSMAKNLAAVTDILGSFAVSSVIDPFAGRGTVGLAAAELDLECTLIEHDADIVAAAKKVLKFIGAEVI